MVDRRPIVGVMGSHDESHTTRARQLGERIAREGYHLLTGGGPGVMEAVTRAFVAVTPRRGLAIGIVPSAAARGQPPKGYPNASVEVPVYTHLDHLGRDGDQAASRNHINVLTARAVVILPGGEGTASEARLALHYGRPVIAYLDRRADVPGLPRDVTIESQFDRIQDFVRDACRREASR